MEWKTGKVAWSKDGFGAGTVTLDGHRLLIVRENGEIVGAAATPKQFQPTVLGKPLPAVVRAYPAVTPDVIVLRNENKLACVNR